MGKRVRRASSSSTSSTPGTPVEGCNYLLALEMEMDPVPGLRDRELGARLRRLRARARPRDRCGAIPWLEGTALVLCDVLWHDGSPVVPSPRQVLRAQVERATELGLTPMLGSELEFFLFKETYAEAHEKHYRDLTPSVPYILDYHILATTYDEDLIRADPERHERRRASSSRTRRARRGRASTRSTSATPTRSRWPTTTSSTRTAPRRSRTSTAARSRSWRSRTTPWVGSSCHIHSSLWRGEESAFAGETDEFRHFLAGQIACAQRAGDLPRADDQLVQALHGRQLGADDARLGPRQPHVRLPRRRARPEPARRDAGSRART